MLPPPFVIDFVTHDHLSSLIKHIDVFRWFILVVDDCILDFILAFRPSRLSVIKPGKDISICLFVSRRDVMSLELCHFITEMIPSIHRLL